MKRRHKYGAIPTYVGELRFDSKGEARRYTELNLLQQAGEIRDLRLQPSFELHALGAPEIKIGEYRADFEYVECGTEERVVEDYKGMKTPLYRWKKKHTEAEYGITIREVTA